jgi:Transposase IS66 family
VRQSDTRPLIEDFKPWLEARLLEVSKKSGLGKAIRYTLNHWDGLTRFIDDGRIEIDSNTVERSIKPIGLGKKNWVFVKSCGWISCKFNRERPVDSGFLEFDRRSDFARESEMISQARYRRRRGTDFGYCDEAAAVA